MTAVNPRPFGLLYNLNIQAEEPGVNPGLPRNGDVRKD